MNADLLISAVEKHVSLTTEETALFLSLLQPKTLKAGSYLLREGEVCRYQSFVNSGCLKTFYQDDDGHEHIIDFSIEGWWADDLYSFFTQTAAELNVKAIELTEIYQINKSNLEILYASVPKFERFFRLLFQNAYIAQRAQIKLSLSATAEERYRLFLSKKPYAEKRFPQKDIASYLGVTPQFLSTLRKKMGR